MKKLFTIFLIIFSIANLSAQYVTPGTGIDWNLDDLVANSGGVVVLETNGQYTINEDLTISDTDQISITTAEEINVADNVLITVEGSMVCDPQGAGLIFFKAQNDHYLGFRFDESEGSSFTSTYFKKAGGINLIYADVQFINCDFSEFNQEYSTGTVDLFHSSPLIEDCSFSYNDGPAVSSGANVDCAPQIIGCDISFNVAANTNTPQINLGTSGADSIRIMNCEIIGNPENDMAGGIAVTTLIGGSAYARIENNVIKDNRYGITCYGGSIGSLIRGNEIKDNNIQGQPMLGGSGINFYGDETNQSIVSGNIITGNLWGITIQSAAQPNFGQLEGDTFNPGANTFMDNGNGGVIYDLYNNTPNPIMAQNNYWGTDDPDEVEDRIYHQSDDPSLGLVDYLPLYSPPVFISETGIATSNTWFSVSPNPAGDYTNIHIDNALAGPTKADLFDASGKCIDEFQFDGSASVVRINLDGQTKGMLFLKITSGNHTETHKIMVR